MKKILLTLAFCLSLGCTINAQDTHVYNNFLSKTVTVDEDGISSHSWNLNFLNLESSSPKSKKGWSHYSGIGPDHIYIGFTEMANTKGFEIKPSSSWEWGFSLAQFGVFNRTRHFGISTELALTRSSYSIKGNDAFHVDNQGWTVCDDALRQSPNSLDYSRQRLIFWSWRVPVTLDFRTKNGFRIHAGAEAELRHHVRSRAKVGNNKKYYIERHDLDVEPFGYNAIVEVGNHAFSIVGRYNLSDMFGDKSKFECQPFMIGLNFNL